MGILHANHNKASGEKGYATEWNANHIVEGDFDFNHYSGTNQVIESRTDYPAGPVEGQIIYRSDLNELQVYDGSAWLAVAGIDTSDWIKKDGSVDFDANQSMDGNKLIDLGAPTADTDAATKKYVDDSIVSPVRTDRGTATTNASGNATVVFGIMFEAVPVVVLTCEGSDNFAALTAVAANQFSLHVTKMSTSGTASAGSHRHTSTSHAHAVGTLANDTFAAHTHTGPSHSHTIQAGDDSEDYGCDFNLGSACGTGACVKDVVCRAFSRKNHTHYGATGSSGTGATSADGSHSHAISGQTAATTPGNTGSGGTHSHTLTLANGATVKVHWVAMEV